MPSVKFFLDEHIPKAVAKGLRLRGIEVLSCAEAKRLTFADAEHIQFAFTEGYVIVTADNDFLTLHSEGAIHAGIASRCRLTSLRSLNLRVLSSVHAI